jgi:hypothetical protein
MEKTYQITESELQALFKKQKNNCADNLDSAIDFLHAKLLVSHAPHPDLSHLKEAPQLPDLKELRERFYKECTKETNEYVEFAFRYDCDPGKVFEWLVTNLQLPKEEGL